MGSKCNFFGWTTVAAHLLLLFANCASAIDLERAKDQSCFKIDKTVAPDANWMMSVKTWYFPLMHRYDLYKDVIEMTGRDPKDISEDEVYYDSCITFKFKGMDFVASGFNDKTLIFENEPLSDTFESSQFTTKGGYNGTCYSILTDNKTFHFSSCCVTGDQMIWGVGSTLPELPKETVKLIHDHAESLGFKRETFARLRYDSCNLEEVENKEEL